MAAGHIAFNAFDEKIDAFEKGLVTDLAGTEFLFAAAIVAKLYIQSSLP